MFSAALLFLRGNILVAAIGAGAVGIVSGYIAGRVDGNQSARVAHLESVAAGYLKTIQDREAADRFAETLVTEFHAAETANDKIENGSLNDAIAKSIKGPSNFDGAFLGGVRKLK